MKKRLLSLVLVFSFIFGTLPVNVLAGAMQTGKSEQKIETITGNGKANVKYRDETDHDLTTLSPSVKIDKEKYPVIAEGQAGKEISKEHLDIEKAPKFIGYKIKSVKTYPVPAKNETANYTTDGKYTVKFIYEKIDDIIEPLKPSDDFPEGYVAVKFFADDSENDRGVFAGNKREVVYAVNPINTEIDMVAKTLKGKKADGKTDIKKDFPTYSVKKASEAIWKTNDKAPWKMNHENAIGPDKKIDVNKLGEHQDLTFTAQYEALTIAEIIKKGNLVPATLKVWVGDTTIPWKKGVKVADTVTDEKLKEKIEGYLNDAETSYKDITTPARTSKGEAVGKPITGTIRVTFSDNSFIDVANQELYVIPHITFSTNDKAPDNAIEVTFKLGEGVKAGDKTGKETAVEYGMYKVKPNTKLDDYKLGTGKTIFGSINAVVTDNKKYTGVVWEGQTANKPEDHVVTDSNKVFTAKATKIFTVKHEFVSGTKGKVLPTTGMPNAPEVVTGKIGSTVNAPTTTYKDVKVAEGTWKFKGWSPATLKVSATDKDNKFVGKWEFTPDKKTVNLTFEFYKKKDSGNTLQPDNALGDFKKPKLENLTGKEVGAEITLPTYSGQTVKTGDLQGTWTFDGWYKGGTKVSGNPKVSATDAENKYVGKWILEETKTAIVSHVFKIDPSIVGNDKVVKPTHELPQGVKNQKRQQTTNYVGSIVNPISKPAFTAVPETINGKQGTWTFKEWTPKELIVNKDESKNVFTGTWTFTESIASILKDKLDLQDISVWLKDDINWKNGVKLKEGTVDTDGKLKGLLDKATVTDESNRNSNTVGEYPGTLKLAFEDGSELKVDKQNLYVRDNFISKDGKNSPKDAIEVKFYLGEGVKVVKGDVTTEGNKDNPKLYATYKIKPGTDLGTYKHSQLKETIFELINAKANKGYSAPVTWKGNKASNTKNYIVSKENNEFTAKATKIFTVKHEFVSGTKGKVLPTTGMPNAPEVVTGKIGSTVNAPTTTYKDVKVAEGTWKFKGWSPATLKVSATDKDNKFVGKWEFTPDKKTVNLTFEFYKKKDSGNVQQPYNALGDFKKPDLKNLTGQDVGAEITLPKYQGQTVNTGDLQGTWKFDGWYRGDKKLTNAKVSAIDAENKLVGKWILTETKTAKVTREFVIDPTIMGDGKDVPTGHKLPNAVKVDQKVNDTTNYIGSTQTPGKDKFTAVPETINGKQGTWTFKEWTPKELTVNKEEAKNVFTGTWTWTEKDKIEVKYVFETKPNNKTLPEALKALKPEDRVGDKAVYEDNKPADPKAPDTSSEAAQKALVEMKGGNKVGEWKAGNWVKTTDAKGNITYTLTWTFEEVKKDKPRPSTPTRPSTPSTPSTPVRVNGKDRVDTAIEISKKYFGQAERVIIVDASNFPDAMAASALAKQLKAPILLTKSNNLDSRVAAEIKRLGAHNVTVIGGKSSVSDGALNQISKFDKDGVERISGKDRYETSAEVARRLAKITGKTGHAVIASGEVFADALAVGPYAAREGYPILLVKSNSIPKSISDLITEIGVKKVSIVGGYGSVSKSLEKSLPLVAERLSGKTRYETAIEIASKGLKTSNKVFVANGAEWMDALVIGPVGGLLNMPILLTGANSAPQSLRDHIAKSKIDKITAIGGRSKVSDRVLNELSK